MGAREALLHEGRAGPIEAPAAGVLVLHVPLGQVHMELVDAFSEEPLAGRSYTLRSAAGRTLAGTTDGQGRLRHRDLPVDEYTLTVAGVPEEVRALLLDAQDPEPLRRFVGGLWGGLGGPDDGA